jgi:hypothetical protein
MASELDRLAEELQKKQGLDLADVFRGTNAETAMVVASLVGETLELALKSKLDLWFSVVLVLLAIVSAFVSIPYVSEYALWVAVVTLAPTSIDMYASGFAPDF